MQVRGLNDNITNYLRNLRIIKRVPVRKLAGLTKINMSRIEAFENGSRIPTVSELALILKGLRESASFGFAMKLLNKAGRQCN